MTVRFGTCLVCDHVYIDRVSNKGIIAGLYGGDIKMGEMPSTLDLSFYLECWMDDEEEHDVEVMIAINGKTIASMKGRVRGGGPGTPAILASPVMKLMIEEEGSLELRGALDGGKSKKLVSKNIGRMSG